MGSRIRISVLLLSLLALLATAGRAEISARRDSLRAAVIQLEDLASSGNARVSTADIDWAINMAITPVCVAFPAVEKTTIIIATKTGGGVALPSDFLRIRGVMKKFGDTAYAPLQPIEVEVAWEKGTQPLSQKGIAVQGRSTASDPRYYWTFGDSIYFYTKVLKDGTRPDSFYVHYYAQGRYLSSDTAVTDIQPEYRVPLVLKAAEFVALLRKNYQDAAQYQALFDNAAKKTEEELKK